MSGTDVAETEHTTDPVGVVDTEDANPADQDLVGMSVCSVDEAYDMYNYYAFRVGFSVRRGKQRYSSATKTMKTKMFHCSKDGFKRSTGKGCYSKIDGRTGCGAFVQFDLHENGMWIVSKHEKLHNHELVPPSKSYLLRSYRMVSRNHISYLTDLKSSGVSVADGVRFLKTQSGGSPLVGFTSRDAYNSLCTDALNRLDGTDSNKLIEIFKRRQSSERDFYFDFEVDLESRLCSFFLRDGRMRRDYDLFGDLLVHDTTYRTNKYDMICGPFVGMNNHCMNVMFGCGFLMNEKIESFVWLFKTFLRSMDYKSPQSIMTYQCAAMAAAIVQVFPSSRHRLCIWHIGENSKKHIKGLRNKKDFLDIFNCLLKYTDTEAEFEFYWTRMVTTYKCHNNHWIEKLYGCREKWCPAFNKDYFSDGILSSQRSETTNHSISRRLSKTSGLCDFYNSFVGVISEWRSRENGEDVRCSQGVPTMVMDNVKILLHAREIYTIEIYYLFEEQFLKGGSCYQECVMLEDGVYKYHVWRPDVDIIRHEVVFNSRQMDIGCICKLFTELGILCCHCLRILNVHCVSEVLEKYILKRWTKKVVEVDNVDIMSRVDSGNGASSVWLLEIIRKFQRLAVYSQENIEGRKICEELIADAKRRLEAECGGSLFEDCDIGSTSGVIKDPSTRQMKGLRNWRVSSVISKKYNKARGRKHLANMVASKIKSAIQSQVEGDILNIAGDGYLVHPSSGGSSFCHVSTMSSMDDN
ncbi:PREDICTED: protein FAR1-RELATED SEQUENCE 7-like [Ipomoea nil]|uniref:protein FAR1-RELATED SEQUENCE 7-like n=1 Tax=Ipomoea nil TaxID=35883 RepID=UPI000900CBDB|nr:PREDICTED: protein FAR1-RELATED SEQUENCE 7-like [Ipomoea nil]